MVSSQQGQAPTTIDLKGNTAAINEAQSNLPLPEQPPVASDFNSSDASTVNVGSGGNAASTDSGASALGDRQGAAGRETKDGLGGIPNDAVSRDAKDHKGLADTTKQ